MDIQMNPQVIPAPDTMQSSESSIEVIPELDVNIVSAEESVQTPNALSLLAQYSGSESDDNDDDEVDNSVYRKPKSESSSSSSTDSDEELDIKVIEKKIREPVVDHSDGDTDEEGGNKKKKREPLKVKGEMTIDDLPPIQDLQITVDERECMEIGTITTIVDQLVLVEALRNSIPLDIDSVLFLDNGKQALGKIFDVIGPVAVPIYCVRFNTNDDILAKGIAVGNKVFCAPRTEYSSFVILSNIMTKGSDASWKNDIEPPENMVDHSDDEHERSTKRKAKANRQRNPNPNANNEPREYIRPRHHMMDRHPPQNLAYPNYSWHQNISPNNYNQHRNFPQNNHGQQSFPQNFQQQQNYPQNFPQQQSYPQQQYGPQNPSQQ